MTWKVELTEQSRRQLSKLGSDAATRITRFLKDRVTVIDDPRQIGEPLVGDRSGQWRYRVGDYRVICRIVDDRLVVLVVEIGHCREVYR